MENNQLSTLMKIKMDTDNSSTQKQEVEFEIMFKNFSASDLKSQNENAIAQINNRMDEIDYKVDELNIEIDRLTNHADMLDNIVAVSSGVITGLFDSFFVGEFSLERGRSIASEKVDAFVMKTAKMLGYKGDSPSGAVAFLEKNFPIPSDGNTPDFGGGLQHHLRDFAHHPTIVGLIFSLLTQFTYKSYGTNVNGRFIVCDVPEKSKIFIGTDVPTKIFWGTIRWAFHLISDMAGSNGTIGKSGGTGIPGPLVSLLKELSVLPFFRDLKGKELEFYEWISKLFNGTLFSKRDSNNKIILDSVVKFDLRGEIGLGIEIGRQALPVIANECIVRGFYFIRRLCMEIKENNIQSISDLDKINWKNTLPAKNRTITRMLTIATGTFTAVDLADATIRAAIKSGGFNASTVGFFLLRVNFVGVGRFVVAISTDVAMGIKKNIRENEVSKLNTEKLLLTNAKIYYQESNMWIEAKNAEKIINEVKENIKSGIKFQIESRNAISEGLDVISDGISEIDKKNPGYKDDILELLQWG